MDTDNFSAFIAIIPYEELKFTCDTIPKTWKMYVKSEMESPETRKCVFIVPRKISMNHFEKTVHRALQFCGTSCHDGHSRHKLRTSYIRWRQWMSESDYIKLSEIQRKRSKFLNSPWYPHPNNPNKTTSNRPSFLELVKQNT